MTQRRWRELSKRDWRTRSRDRSTPEYEEQILLHEGSDRERWVVTDEHQAAPDAPGMDIERPLMASVGQSMTRLGQGARSLTGLVSDPLFGEDSRGQIAEERADAAPGDAALFEQHPAQNIIGQGIPYVLGGAAAAPAGLPAIVATEAALAGIDYAPSGLQRIANATLGGALSLAGGAAGQMATRVSQRIRANAEGRKAAREAAAAAPPPRMDLEGDAELLGTVDAELAGTATHRAPGPPASGVSRASHGYQDRLARAEELGYQPTPAQRTLDMGQEQWEAGRARQPATSEEFLKKYMHNQETLNRQVGEAMGVGTGFQGGRFSIQPQVLVKAEDQAVRLMGDLAGEIKPVAITGDTMQTLARQVGEGAADVTGDLKSIQPMLTRMAEIAQDSGGKLSGEQLLQIRSGLSRKLREAKGAQASNTPLLQRFIEGIDNLIEGSGAATQTINRFRVARARWRLTQAVQAGNVLDKAGNVNVASLYNRLSKDFKYEFAKGHGMRWGPEAKSGAAKGTPRYGIQSMNDLFEGVRWMAEAQSKIPNSGTPTGMAPLVGGVTDVAGRLAGNTAMKGYMGLGGKYPGLTAQGIKALQGGGMGELGAFMPNIPAATAPASAVLGGASSPFVEELLQ